MNPTIEKTETALPERYVKAREALRLCWDEGERVPWKDQLAAMSPDEKYQALGSYARMADDKTLQRLASRIRARANRKMLNSTGRARP